MQSLVGKIEQLTSNKPHPEVGIKSLKEKSQKLNAITPYFELNTNQSAVIFSDFEDGVEISLAVGVIDETEVPIKNGAVIAIALMQRIEKDPEFLEKILELFEPNSEE